MTLSKTLCVNGQRYFHRFVVKELRKPIDLCQWLQIQKMTPKSFWRDREGVEVACLGSVLTLYDIPHFDSHNDSPARFWGGHAFFPSFPPKDEVWSGFDRCCFFLPKCEIIRKGNHTTIVFNAINSPLDESISMEEARLFQEKISLTSSTMVPKFEKWIDLIQISLDKIGEKTFDKVVMGRRLSYLCEKQISPFVMLSKLHAVNSILFAFQFSMESTFMGATPERLYKREGNTLSTEAMAGTRKRGKTPEEDASLANELLENIKERREFEFVKKSIHEALNPLCKKLFSEKEDAVLKTSNVQHLYHPFEAILYPDVDDEAILQALHPTAAMGGLPKKQALEHIFCHEPFERGWYASPIGMISQERAEFAVGIRSALALENTLHLFGAAGIVEGSIAQKEWEEIEQKTSLWRNL